MSNDNNNQYKKPKSPIKRLYNWTVKWAKKDNAEYVSALPTALEGIIFPIPTDPLMMAMTFAKPKKWLRYSLITLTASILGGIVGYLIGFGLFETIGDWILTTFHLQDGFNQLGQSFEDNGGVYVFTAAVTPIPYKLVTLTSGAFQINFVVFLIASILGRGARFLLLGFLASHLGAKYRDQIEKYIDVIGIAIVVLLVVFLLLR
jgi:membrane protein YqaA with SNARE-associated domain